MNLNVFILKFLLRLNCQPATLETICMGVGMTFPNTPRAEITNVLDGLEADGLVSGQTIKLLQTTSWMLTVKGRHEALQLGK